MGVLARFHEAGPTGGRFERTAALADEGAPAMKRTCMALLGIASLSLVGCAGDQQTTVTESPEVASTQRLGASDSRGRSLFQTDRGIAEAESRDRTLAAHPDE